MANNINSDLVELLKLLGNVEVKLNELKASAGSGNLGNLEKINAAEAIRNQLLKDRIALISRANTTAESNLRSQYSSGPANQSKSSSATEAELKRLENLKREMDKIRNGIASKTMTRDSESSKRLVSSLTKSIKEDNTRLEELATKRDAILNKIKARDEKAANYKVNVSNSRLSGATQANIPGGHEDQAGPTESPRQSTTPTSTTTGKSKAAQRLEKEAQERQAAIAKLAETNKSLAIIIAEAKKLGYELEHLTGAKALVGGGYSASFARTTNGVDYKQNVYADNAGNVSLNAPIRKTEGRLLAEQQLRDAQELVKSNLRYQQALEQASKLGLRAEHLRLVEDRNGGKQKLVFSNVEGGKTNKFTTFVDQYGKSTPGLSSQFRSFGSDIVRDIGQFTKWSIAVAAVYTPLQKLGELMSIMVENQSKLADATIAANVPFEKSGQIFDQVYESAQKAGEGVTITIDAYSQAIRAAGRYTGEQQKLEQSTALLNSALILSKLSTLDQSTAIDTLTAALLQSERELDGGEELLNKWVRVSQVANVDIATLATGVAVLGDAAETAGLGIDQLNGLIAVLSEQSISGSKEAANTAKALIGSYQSDKAEASLNKFGIALRKSNGEVRSFLEIYQQLADLRAAGLISPENVSEIALALGGGGSRRAKDASALINSQDRLNELARESSEVNGKSSLAQDSLAKKLETVETANTRLANSFQSLAETLGNDGGLLDVFKDVLNALTFITDGADKLFSVLGRSGPTLATFVTSIGLLSRISPASKELMLSTLQTRKFSGFIGGQPQYSTGYGGGVGGFGRGILGDILQLNLRGAGILGAAAVGSSAIGNLRAGKEENAAANVIGGAIGAAIGFALGGPIGLAAGAAIGSSAGDSFVNIVMSHSQDLEDYFANIIPIQGPADTSGRDTKNSVLDVQTNEDLIKQLYTIVGNSTGYGGAVTPKLGEFGGSLASNLLYYGSKFLPGNNFESESSAALQLLKQQAAGGNKQADLLLSQLQTQIDYKNKQEDVYTNPADFEKNRQQILSLQGLAENERRNQLDKLVRGEIRPSEYGKISDALGGFPTSAKQEVDAFGKAFIDVSKDIDNTSEAYEALLQLTIYGTKEQKDQINSYVSDIQKMQAAYDNWNPQQKDLVLELSTGKQLFETKDSLGKGLSRTQAEAAQFTNTSVIEAKLNQLKLPQIVGSATEATSQTDVNAIKNQAEKLQEQFFTDMKLTTEEIEHLKSGLEDFSVLVGDAAENHFNTISGIDQKFWDAAQKLLEKQNKLQKVNDGFGFQQFDVNRSQLEAAAKQSVALGNAWESKFPGFESKQEDLLAITNDGLAKPIHADFKILALLLQKMVDQNQKQLDGQYNIPEGATFWVPLNAAYYRRSPDSGSGDISKFLNQLMAGLGETTNISNAEKYKDNFIGKKYPDVRDPKEESSLTGTTVSSARTARLSDTSAYKPGYQFKSSDEKSGVRGEGETVFQNLQRQLETLFRNLLGIPTSSDGVGRRRGGVGLGTGYEGTIGTDGKSGGRQMLPQNIPQQSSRLDLRFQSNVNLMVDGRALANVVRTYLASELVKTNSSQGTVTKTFVI